MKNVCLVILITCLKYFWRRMFYLTTNKTIDQMLTFSCFCLVHEKIKHIELQSVESFFIKINGVECLASTWASEATPFTSNKIETVSCCCCPKMKLSTHHTSYIRTVAKMLCESYKEYMGRFWNKKDTLWNEKRKHKKYVYT